MGLFTKKTSKQIGDYIPAFTLKNQDNLEVSLPKEITGKGAIIYFYPKNESGVCTKEACAFRDHHEEFLRAGIDVFGINAGSVAEHAKFRDHHKLPFSLLSDPGNRVLKSFGIPGVLFLTGRETFVADQNGKIIYKYRGFLNGEAHVKEVMHYLHMQ